MIVIADYDGWEDIEDFDVDHSYWFKSMATSIEVSMLTIRLLVSLTK
ncbi:hypothetical protein BTN49_1566 [Candidatus Enterovibrio escicola]|uniref:Uncharacterized protein n=1 Tax=Candidatus Enterovibrio escicola TaxID=1927127 RepID=A0A2A5T3T1_9GAMM|nr:hypothetical protein BTN49_1566 [Candidatus Enterovibrio escacola]